MDRGSLIDFRRLPSTLEHGVFPCFLRKAVQCMTTLGPRFHCTYGGCGDIQVAVAVLVDAFT